MQKKTSNNLINTALYAVLVCGIAIGSSYIATLYLPTIFIVKLLKFLIGIIAIVWAFSMLVYNKLWDITDLPGLDYRQHRNIEIEVRSRLYWFWLRAIFLGLLTIIMYVPSIIHEAEYCLPYWIIRAAFVAFGLALFSLRHLWVELEEIRELKSHVKELERQEKERLDQLKLLKDGAEDNWSQDPNLDGFRASSKSKDEI